MKTGIEISVKLVNGALVPATAADHAEMLKFQNRYKKILPESFRIWLETEETSEKNRKKYLDKLHKMFRLIAAETGNDFSDIKEYIKQQNGVTTLADCDTVELGHLINYTTKFADSHGIKT